MTTAFVLSGGGSLGAVQVGMLAALNERGFRPDLLVGTSVGALNAAYLGVNGYDASTMTWVRLIDDSGADGSGINNAFLDGFGDAPDIDDVSSDDHALIQFGNLFGTQTGQVPKTSQIVKAELVLTTTGVGNAQTGAVFEAHQMLRGWAPGTTWTDFNPDDLTLGISSAVYVVP